MKYKYKRDGNEAEIVKAMEAIGATVNKINGRDIPDLLVSYRGKWFVMEVKTKIGKLREGQERFQQVNCAPVYVVRTSDEAIEVLTNN